MLGLMGEFRGWPREAIGFFEELEANNDRDWFHANRARYEELIADPARALAEDLAQLGRPKVFRPFNDTRFRPGPPIKEHVGVAIGYEGSGGWYVQLSLDGLFIAAGLHNPASDQIARLREAVADGRRAAALTRAVKSAEAVGLALNEPDMKRVPRGYDATHPRAEMLMRRRLVVTRTDRLAGWLHKPEAGRRIRTALDGAAPVVRWLRDNVGPSTTPR